MTTSRSCVFSDTEQRCFSVLPGSVARLTAPQSQTPGGRPPRQSGCGSLCKECRKKTGKTGITPDKAGAPYEEFQLRTADGVTLHGWRVPARPKKTGGTLIVFHGNAGDLTTATERLVLYSSLGWDVYMVDYHGFGKSGGSPSEENLYLDADALWRYVTKESGADAKEIVLMGYSLGGGVASRLAEQHPEVAGLVLESTFTKLADVADSLFPWLPCRLILGDAYDTETRLAKLSLPLLVVHGRGDQLVPYRLGQKLFQTYAGEKSFLTIADDHNIGFLLSGNVYRDGLGEFLQKTIPSAQSAASHGREK